MFEQQAAHEEGPTCFLLPSLMRERPASRSSCCSNGQLGVKRDLPSGATVSLSPPSPTDPLLCFLSNSFFYAPLFLFFLLLKSPSLVKSQLGGFLASTLGVRESARQWGVVG